MLALPHPRTNPSTPFPSAELISSAEGILQKHQCSPADLGELYGHYLRLLHCLGPQGRLERGAMLIFCGDHGLSHIPGTSAYPREVTVQMCHNYLGGGAGANVLGKQNGFDLSFFDCGVDWDCTPAGMLPHSQGKGTANIAHGPAMTALELKEALELGKRAVAQYLKQGYSFFAMGEMGISNTCASALIFAAFCQMDVAELCGRGSGVKNLNFKTQLLQSIQKHDLAPSDPLAILQAYAGFEMAQMCGAMIACGQRQIPLLVDGYIATACFCMAQTLEPSLCQSSFLCHRSAERGQSTALQHLQLPIPLLDLGLRLGEGTGAAVAKPILDSLCLLL